jgi:DNA-binding transcriptional LysR family regulator
MIREWKGIEDRFRHDAVQPRGRLRIVASVGLGQFVLVEIAARYCRRYPEVEIEWNVDDGPVSVLQSGIDCLLKVGHIEEKSLVTQTVAEVRAMLVASPGLIAEMGMPSIPAELAGWPMIGVHPYFADSIAIRSHRGRASRVRGSRRFLTSNIVVARSAALAGAGFTLLADCLPAGLPKQIYYSTTYTTARRFSGAVRRGIGRPFGGFGIRART